jgi:hypothetical protein
MKLETEAVGTGYRVQVTIPTSTILTSVRGTNKQIHPFVYPLGFPCISVRKTANINVKNFNQFKLQLRAGNSFNS